MEYRSEISEHGKESTKAGLLGVKYRNKYKNYLIKLIRSQEKGQNFWKQVLNYIDR